MAVEGLVEEPGFQEYSTTTRDLQLYNQSSIVHKLSHQHIHTRFWILHCERLPQQGIPLHEIKTYPVPRLIDKFMEAYNF